MRCSFSTRANRTWPSPYSPKPMPGETATLHVRDQHLGELERAHGAERVGDRRPHEHRPPRLGDRPADLVEPVHEHVAPLPVQLDDLLDHLLVALERDDARDLDGLERAVVEVGLDARERVDHPRIAADEAHAPSGHVVGLRQREDLDADLLGPRHLEERRRPVAVVAEVRVGEVVHHHEPVLAGEVDHLHEEVALHAEGGRIVREREDEHLGLGPRQPNRLREAGEEVVALHQRHRAQVPVRDDHRVRVDRVRRIRHEHAVAGLKDREREMRHALLGADRRDGLRLGIELHAVAIAVPRGHGTPEPRDPLRGRVAVVLRIARGLDQLVDDVLGGGLVGIPHPQIDDVLAPSSRLRLEVVDDGEDVRRQALDPVEVFHVGGSWVGSMICARARTVNNSRG